MITSACRHDQTKRHGHDRHGNQRFRCVLCGKTWVDPQPNLLGQMRLDKGKAILCLRLLLEGSSIRSVERITRVHRDTILRLLETLGRRALSYWNTMMRNLPATDVEVDEVWGFIRCKEKTKKRRNYGEDCGDAYCFTAIESTTKLLLAWHLGRRTPSSTALFTEALRRAVSGRFQLTTDGFPPYALLVPAALCGRVDFAQLIKIYGTQPTDGATRYSPAEIVGLRLHSVCGYPDLGRVCTSHVERSNLSIRMAIRRMTRLTNAHSKKWENHEYHLALYFLYYNLCRVHSTLKTTPAVASGLADHPWELEELLGALATQS